MFLPGMEEPGGLPSMGWHRVRHDWSDLAAAAVTRAQGFPDGSVVKNPPANARDARNAGLIPGSGRSPGEGDDNALWYSCLENPMDRRAWRAMSMGLQRVEQNWSNLARMHTNLWVHLFSMFAQVHFQERNFFVIELKYSRSPGKP